MRKRVFVSRVYADNHARVRKRNIQVTPMLPEGIYVGAPRKHSLHP
jgi:hypothetical protein